MHNPSTTTATCWPSFVSIFPCENISLLANQRCKWKSQTGLIIVFFCLSPVRAVVLGSCCLGWSLWVPWASLGYPGADGQPEPERLVSPQQRGERDAHSERDATAITEGDSPSSTAEIPASSGQTSVPSHRARESLAETMFPRASPLTGITTAPYYLRGERFYPEEALHLDRKRNPRKRRTCF